VRKSGNGNAGVPPKSVREFCTAQTAVGEIGRPPACGQTGACAPILALPFTPRLRQGKPACRCGSSWPQPAPLDAGRRPLNRCPGCWGATPAGLCCQAIAGYPRRANALCDAGFSAIRARGWTPLNMAEAGKESLLEGKTFNKLHVPSARFFEKSASW